MALHHRIIAASTSGQSHLIVAAVLLSFIVWTTLQGHLHAYLNALGIGSPPNLAPVGTATGQAIGGAIAGGTFNPGPLTVIPQLPGFPSIQTPPYIPNLVTPGT